jgi:hypothetical protein
MNFWITCTAAMIEETAVIFRLCAVARSDGHSVTSVINPNPVPSHYHVTICTKRTYNILKMCHFHAVLIIICKHMCRVGIHG